MNQVLVMAIKDLRLLFRDKLGAFFIIGFPILMGIFFWHGKWATPPQAAAGQR